MELNILRTGAKARTKLDKIQRDIADAREQLTGLARGPVSIAEARERLTRALEWPVQDAALAFESLLAHEAGHVALPKSVGIGEYAYLHGVDTFIDSVLARISHKAGPGVDERAARVHALQEELRGLLVAEEREVLELERRGHAVLRRADAEVGVLLEVWAEHDPA